ncbi:MAG TPA: formate dehydrogenase subunit alpha, partial [Oscillospiraceae bacterium]|nr:formate dehydrogenase subunit alpha [Oscillospiraceae bacterium]
FINHSSRLTTPLIKKDGKLVKATWDEAYQLITKKVKEIKNKYGSDVFAGLSSARYTNEENYLFQRLVRTAFGTNNIDHCARLCHSSTVVGLATTLGCGAMTNSIGEIRDTDLMFVIGSNTTENHPVIANHMRQAQKKGAKLIVADPREIDLTKIADIYLQLKPGNNIALINGMMHEIIKNNWYDQKFVAEQTEGFDELVKHLQDFTPEKVAAVCGITAEEIKKAAQLYAEADKAGIFYAMGITQHLSGVHATMALSNLAMLCGNIGKESAGINPLRGQNNVQGASDMGCLPGDYPGYQKVYHAEMRKKFEQAWGVSLPDKIGLTLSEIIHGGGNGTIKFLYITGENPMMTDPDISKVQQSLANLEFFVVQDIFLTETAALADVVLPASSFAEKDGTFTNTERRIQRVRKAIEPLGDSKPDWVIFTELMARLGLPQNYQSPAEIMAEIASVVPEYAGITYERLEEVGIQWPCLAADHPGTPILHKDKIDRGKGLFVTVDNISSAELADYDYPFIMTTGRNLYQYHAMSMSGKVDELNNKSAESYIEINTATVARLGLNDGDQVKVSSRRGSITTTVKATDKIGEEVMFMPMHFSDAKVNYLTNTAVDAMAKIPELKVAAVKVERM